MTNTSHPHNKVVAIVGSDLQRKVYLCGQKNEPLKQEGGIEVIHSRLFRIRLKWLIYGNIEHIKVLSRDGCEEEGLKG